MSLGVVRRNDIVRRNCTTRKLSNKFDELENVNAEDVHVVDVDLLRFDSSASCLCYR